jgi:hypothetical protein
MATAAFSVAAVPSQIRFNSMSVNNGTAVTTGPGKYDVLIGLRYGLEIVSDSGKLDDLDKIQVSEKIVDPQKNGLLKDWPDPQVGSWFNPTDPQNRPDADRLPIVKLGESATDGQTAITQVRDRTIDALNAASQANPNTTTGTITNNQYFAFADARTGVTTTAPAKIIQSGFKHTMTVTKKGDNEYEFKVTKTAAANNGVVAGDMKAEYQTEQTFTIKK